MTRSGISVSHLYYYFPSKVSVLKSLMGDIARDLIASLEAALAKAGDSPTERLSALVKGQVLFHSRRQAEAVVGRSELRSLEDADRAEIVVMYDGFIAIVNKWRRNMTTELRDQNAKL
jgi:AcrR family transcriptional regulator